MRTFQKAYRIQKAKNRPNQDWAGFTAFFTFPILTQHRRERLRHGPWRGNHIEADTWVRSISLWPKKDKGFKKSPHLSRKGNISGCPGVFRQSLMSSQAIANNEMTCTPAARIRSLASLAVLASNVPEASLCANTE